MYFWKKLFEVKDPAEFFDTPKPPGFTSFSSLAKSYEGFAESQAGREDYEGARKDYEKAVDFLNMEMQLVKDIQKEYFLKDRKPCREVLYRAIKDLSLKSRALGAAESSPLANNENVIGQLSEAVQKSREALLCLVYESRLTDEEFESRLNNFDFDNE